MNSSKFYNFSNHWLDGHKLEHKWVFQQDSDAKHTSKLTLDCNKLKSVPGIPTLKLVNVTALSVIHLNMFLSSVLDKPVQKYFSGLKPTKLTRKAFSYLHENIHKVWHMCDISALELSVE